MSLSHRTEARDVQTMSIVVLRGVIEGLPDISCIGWVEDKPHAASDEAVVLQEPLYFKYRHQPATGTTPSNTQVLFAVPELGIPLQGEFFEYGGIDVYEGTTPLGELYIRELVAMRSMRPAFAVARQSFSLRPVPATPSQNIK